MSHNKNRFRTRRRTAMLAVTAFTALLTAACGSPSSTGSGGSPNAGGTAQSKQLAFAQCMRSHGVTDFPDSGGPIQPSPHSDLNPGNPTYRAAQQACRSLLPTLHLSPAQQAQDNADALKFAVCMRNHGIIHYPDPQAGTGGNAIVNLTRIRNLLNTPQFQAAQHACRRYGVAGKG